MAENLAGSIRRLGWDALVSLQKVDSSSNGIILSSLSITIAIAMFAGAAEAEQKAKLCTRMGVADPTDLANTFATALQTLQTNAGHSLEIANKVFVDDSINIRDSYVKFLSSLSADLASFPDLSKEAGTINGWVSEHTHGIIKQIVNDALLKDSQILLVNALAFKGQWRKAFEPKATVKNYAFLSSQNKSKTVDMMFLPKSKILLSDHSNYTAMRLPYRMPDPSQPQIYFEAYLPNTDTSLEDLLPIISHESPSQFKLTELTHLGLPKFSLETSQDITSILSSLGYPLGGAWPGMIADGSGSRLSNLVIHKAAIKVDEKGTVAAAVTAVIARKARVVGPTRSVVFDRAFPYAIVDESGMTYFNGLFT